MKDDDTLQQAVIKDNNPKSSGIVWETFRGPRRRSGKGGKGAFLAISKSQRKDGSDIRVSITFSAELMRKMRWVVGDRVMIGVDADGLCCIARATDGEGLLLTTIGSIPHEKAVGQFVRSNLKFRPTDRFQPKSYVAFSEADVVADGGILRFVYPE